MWPFTESAPNDIEKIEKDPGALVCLKCGVTPQTMLNVNGLYYCEPCHEANQRIERWNAEEAEWSKTDTKKD